MKKTSALILRNSLLLLATLFTISSFAATAQTKLAPARITQAIDEANLVPMHARVHPRARVEFDRGVVPDSQPMNRMLLVLQRSPQQEAALRNLMDEQQTKNSPNYHAWLTPQQFGQQFGVADADIQKVTAWLTQKGFTGIKTSPGNMFIEFSGTAGLVRNAFHTEIHSFMVNGEAHMANVSVPQIPAALAPVVTTVHSLHNFRKKSFLHFSKTLEEAKAKAAANGKQFTYANICPNPGTPTQGTQPCAAVAPGDFAKIYNLPSNLDGTGQTIALVARSNITLSDITQFGTAFGISNLTNFSYANNVVLTGPDPGILVADDGEATLDIEWSGAVAPKAKILLVVSDTQASTFIDGVDLSAIYIVVNNLAPIMSESFGSCEAENSGLDTVLWEQAASQGITVMVSTGDTGSASCDPDQFSGNFTNASDAGLAVSGTASTQFNVAVGGTDFDDATNPATYWNSTNSGTGLASVKSYIPEITWNGGCASAATSATLNSICQSPLIDLQDPNSPDLSGGGGGASNCSSNTVNADGSVTCISGTSKPVWQQSTGLTGMPADGVRDIPDVSLFAAVNTASNNFYIMCLADSTSQNGQPCSLTGNLNFTGVGGTSVSSPAFAGIVALVNQNEVNNSRLKAGEGQGNVNYVLYKLAATQYANAALSCNSSTGPNASCTFNDVTKGNNSVACVGSFPTLFPNLFDSFTTPDCSTATANAIGVLVEPSSSATPGWTTTAGYDLATGLGSVNVSNLVTNWGNVTTNYNASTSTITSTLPATLTALSHGQNVTFNVSVTSGSGTPSGDVTLVPAATLATNGTIFATLATGTASIVTNQLPGGTYPVVVHYAGDGTFAPSDSAPVTVTVSKENSTSATTMWEYWTATSAPLAPASAPYGSPYLFRVDVIGSQNQDNQQCSAVTVTIPCPTGKVTFTADGNPLNDFLNTATGVSTNSALLNPFGFVEDRVLGNTGLSVGSHSIAASYAGDSSYNPSTAPALGITITPTATQTGVTLNGLATATAYTGQSVTLTATVFTQSPVTGTGSSGAGPTGSVTFSACGTANSCTVTVVPTTSTNLIGSAFATATLPTTFTTVGTQNITATFTSSSGNYNSCTTPVSTATTLCTLSSLALTVTLPPSKLAFTVPPSNVAVGASIAPPVQVSVEDTNGNVVTSATNAVTIAIGNNAGPGGVLSGTLTVAPVNGVVTFSNLSINKAGTGYTLTAAATGLTGATSSAFNVTAAVPTKLAFTVQPSNVAVNASITPPVQVSVEDALGNLIATATNAVTIAIGNNAGPGGVLSGTLTTNAVAGVATFSNLSINTAGTGYTLTAAAAGLTSATSSAFNVTPAGGGTFTVSYSPQPLILSSATGAASTLTVTVTPSGGFTGMVAVTPTAATLPPGVSCTPSPLNINVTAATAATSQLMCSVTATSTVLTASNAREDRMLEAKTVPPTIGGKGWWTLSAGTGFAALFLLFLPGGRKKYRAALGLGLVCILGLTAGCNGSSGGVIPPPKITTVTKLTVTNGTNGRIASGTPFTFSVAVTGGTPTGMVQLFDGATMTGTAASVVAGTAVPTAPALAVGTHAISAQYLGDTTTKPSASGTLNLTVTGTTSITITTSPAATPVAPAINVTIQ